MHPWLMAALMATAVGVFVRSAAVRFKSLRAGAPLAEPRTNRLGDRLHAVWTLALAQRKMRYYPLAGIAHQLIFIGFWVLLLRSLVLFGRGFVANFDFGGALPGGAAGPWACGYGFAKDTCVVLVLLGTLVFGYLRLVKRESRLTLNAEGLLILAIIACMMLADLTYDGALVVIHWRQPAGCTGQDVWCAHANQLVAPLGPALKPSWRFYPDPAGSAVAMLFAELGVPALVVLAELGLWTHVTLALLFLNLLPFSKHFHVLTGIPNVFLDDLGPRGRLRPLASTADRLMELVERASTESDSPSLSVGYARFRHLTWKDRLDLMSCTECGRCSEHCPAARTGKKLDPKRLTLDLRTQLYSRKPADELVPQVIDPDVLWGCMTCRACEEQCPVSIRYVDKIVAMRQDLVMMRGEHFPPELSRLFDALETNGNPWNLARDERAGWADGVGIRTYAEYPTAKTLFWVGCIASYDPRAQQVARAVARLLMAAGEEFAILGSEESCTGDAARRAGNEYLFLKLAERNLSTLGRYRRQGGIQTIVTLCPHCQHTLANEYPDFGGQYRVVSHASFLLKLLDQGRLSPKRPLGGRVVYHDSCYLGRYAGEYGAPRTLIDGLPQTVRVEPHRFARQHGLCCGAGGAQMWLEEQNERRVNAHRLHQLTGTGADVVTSACPFCLLMLGDAVKETDSLAGSPLVERLPNAEPIQDIAELLAYACGLSDRPIAAS
jgi:Fe-S oxidoreductase